MSSLNPRNRGPWPYRPAISSSRSRIKITHLCPSKLIWIGRVTSHPLGMTYVIKVRYQMFRFRKSEPHPPLEKRRGENIPHMHAQERLCLFHPSDNQWSARKLLTHTILPWTALWLYHNEMWHATGRVAWRRRASCNRTDELTARNLIQIGKAIHQPENRSRAALHAFESSSSPITFEIGSTYQCLSCVTYNRSKKPVFSS